MLHKFAAAPAESFGTGKVANVTVLHHRCPVASTLLRQDQEDEMDQAGIVTLIDEALKRFAGRDLVSSNEVLDLLLDMRTAAVSDAAIAALIDAEAQPAH
jgi:hypothetical protein